MTGDRLRNRVAIVTGSGRGIGKEIALSLAREGARVVTNDIIHGSAEATANDITSMGSQAVAFPCDTTDFGATGKLVKTAVDNFGKLDILINNVGLAQLKLIWEMTEQDWDRVINTCLKSTFNCTRQAVELMKEQKWGRIINASSGSRLGGWRLAHYSAAKAGVAAFTVAISWDLMGYGITCNAYCPFATSVTLPQEAQKFMPGRNEDSGVMVEKDYSMPLTPRPGPEYIAPFITYLCTDEASNITGQVFFVGGRRVARYSDGGDELKFILREKEGKWTLDELAEQVPRVLLEGYGGPLKMPQRWIDEWTREK